MYDYDAFGNPVMYDGAGTPLTSSAINNPVLYTGRTWQPKLGLYDYRNRQYDPTTGRFTTPDPLSAHGDWNNLGNAYTYVGNNPGSYLDPMGLDAGSYDYISGDIPKSSLHFLVSRLSDRENPVVRSIEPVIRGGAAFYDGMLPITDFTDSYNPNLGTNIAMKFIGEELNLRNVFITGSLSRVAGALFHKGNFIMNRVFRNSKGLWVDKLGNPLTGTLKHEGKTIALVEGLIDDIAQKGDDVISYSLQGQKLGLVASSKVLAHNLESRGIRRPQGWVAHHIVAGNDKRATRARSILERNGIDINEAVNGVFLPPRSTGLSQSAHGHLQLHTRRYYNQITTELMQAKPGELRNTLADIAENLQKGRFPF